MPLKKTKLRKVLGALSPSLRGELAAEQVKEDVSKSLVQLTAWIAQRFTILKADLLAEFETKLRELPDSSGEITELRDEFSAKLAELEKEQIPTIQEHLQDIVSNEIDNQDLRGEMDDRLSNLRKDILRRLANIGGGQANRNILVDGNSSTLSRYTDLDIRAGDNITLTTTTNDADRTTRLTIAAEGGDITIGATSIVGGTDTRVLFDDNGVVGEDANFVWDKTNNFLGIGVNPPLAKLHIATTPGTDYVLFGNDTTNTAIGALNDVFYSIANQSTTSKGLRTGYFEAQYTGTTNANVNFQGLNAFVSTSSVSTGNLTGTTNGGNLRNRYVIEHAGSGTITLVSAVSAGIRNVGTGTITNAAAINVENAVGAASQTITNLYGVIVRGGAVTGTLTTRYGVYVETLTGGTTKYGIWVNGDPSAFGGVVTPTTNNGAALGNGTLQWSDLFLAEGGVINWDNGDLTLTQTNNVLALAGGDLDIQGALQADSITNDTGLAAGTYTPTRSAEANMDANVTMTEAQYMRVGNTVTVSGRFTADPTTTATATSFEITLPVASNIGAAEDAAGVAFCGAIAGMGAEIIGVAANDTAKIQWISSDVASQTWSYTFTYQVI